jgi:hypothetical protein
MADTKKTSSGVKSSKWGQAGKLGPLQQAMLLKWDIERSSWVPYHVQVRIFDTSFAKGAMREAFQAEIYSPTDKTKIRRVVLKRYIGKSDKENMELLCDDIKMQTIAGRWAEAFNARNVPKKTKFLEIFLLTVKNPDGSTSVYAAEEYLEGRYEKHSNNCGYVHGQKDNTDRNTPQAFSHFTLHESHHRLIIVDIQGVNDFYTDPQVHTDDGKGFGLGNLGRKGMEAFMKSHQCNAICRYLNLPSMQSKSVDVGTKLMDIQNWMKEHHKDPKDKIWDFSGRKPPALDLGFCINDYCVEELNLSMCDLVDEELKAIVMNFGDARAKVAVFNLSNNRITDRGAEHLAEMLQKNKTIRTLILDGNQITDQGLQKIAAAVCENAQSKLIELSVVKNPITQPVDFGDRNILVIYN